MHTELRRINPRKDQGKQTEKNLCCPYLSLAAGWEQMEETFVASSTGEGMELINMVQQEDYQRLRNSAVKDLLLDQSLFLNISIIVLFLQCMT
uniref:Uncharacterized protein n=1 Tax=Anser cygnoides TaxID=8845 RepID=A0A8B9IIJ1_ANSCY